jgi:YcaO-like protein with predicted kinase domain
MLGCEGADFARDYTQVIRIFQLLNLCGSLPTKLVRPFRTTNSEEIEFFHSKSVAEAGARKTFFHGTHRLIAPRKTLERLKPLLGKFGITRVANVTNLDVIGIPVVMVVRPQSRSNCVTQGKGLDLDAAKASGLMESIEAFHAERMNIPLRLATYESLRRQDAVVDPRKLPKHSQGRFHRRRSICWVQGWDLLQKRRVWVPYELVHLNFSLPLPRGSNCFLNSSNGLASGNHPLEAISHGICEVAERDAAALWKLQRASMQAGTRLDFRSIDDPACCRVLRKFDRAGIQVAVWVITSDVGIPAFRCLIYPPKMNWNYSFHSSEGFGCHPSREIALLRALTEAAQGRLTYVAGSRDDLKGEDFEVDFNARYLRQEERLFNMKGPTTTFRAIHTWNFESLNDEVAWELERIQGAGFESVIVVNLTKQQFGIPVVRVVIPTMEVPGTKLGQRAQAFRKKHP